ncbi:MAG: hypothetical protein GWN84_16760 [Gammaproteobacteria bacterium]|nr:hypothetical protein [Gammaproteobacteria bacterium]NIR84489.1 hypothetical protein [Gammaproteobacteria bacterium]NIR90392.1 hypothetical protein [Gammaproteobacteria bacterium]NIU05540.1 hypothetical protein [Gammaproteobacteria bacterium]NIV52679.1 hypothetical protein [Gammaproteobacteria bacterium]
MSHIIQQLQRDHRNAARLLDILDEYLLALPEQSSLDHIRMLDVMRYMTDYPDLFHHPREDLVLQRLVKRDPTAREAAHEILEEHQVIAEKGKRFWQRLRAVVNIPELSTEAVASHGRDYVTAMRRHMQKEESSIFPQAKATLTAADWAEIEHAMEARRDPLFGEEVEAEYEALYHYINALSEGSLER